MAERDFGRVVVTGGAGFIGSHLVDALVPVSGEVVVFDNFSTGSDGNLDHLPEGAVEVIRADIRDRDALANAFAGADVVFHLAVQCLRLSFRDPHGVHEVNATGSLNVALAAAAAGVRRLVYVSSSEVYGTAASVPMDEEHPLNPTTVYGASKLAGELYALAVHRSAGLPVTLVRPFNSYGPRAQMHGVYGEVIPRFVCNALLGQRSTVFGTGEQTRDFTHVEDTARGIRMAARSPDLIGEAVNIAAGRPVSVTTLVRVVAEASDREYIKPLMAEPRPGDVMHHHASIEKARARLGFSPRIPIETGVRDYARWLADRPSLWRDCPEQFVSENW